MNKLIDFLNKNSNNNNCLKKIPVAATAETYITQLLDLFVPNNEVIYTIIKIINRQLITILLMFFVVYLMINIVHF